jgi:sulfate adenylyltransferase subunit 1 (EFTu-like GTPase family)
LILVDEGTNETVAAGMIVWVVAQMAN